MHTTGNMDGTAAASGGIIAKVGFNRWRFLLEGQRVELNAMTSDQFVDFVERKLAEAGIEKVAVAGSRRFCARPSLGTAAGRRRAGRSDCGSIWRRRGNDCKRDAWRSLSLARSLSRRRYGEDRGA